MKTEGTTKSMDMTKHKRHETEYLTDLTARRVYDSAFVKRFSSGFGFFVEAVRYDDLYLFEVLDNDGGHILFAGIHDTLKRALDIAYFVAIWDRIRNN